MALVSGHSHLILNFTDSAATHGQSAACSGAALTADTGNDRAMSDGGTFGTTPYTVTVGAAATEAAMFFESDALNRTAWNLGRWGMLINVTTGNALVGVASLFVCRVNAAGTNQETLGSKTWATPVPLTTGVLKFSVAQAASSTALSTDRVYIVFVLINSDGSAQDVIFTPTYGVRTPMLKETRAVPSGHTRNWSFDQPTVVTTWNLVPPTAERAMTVDSQVAFRGGQQFQI